MNKANNGIKKEVANAYHQWSSTNKSNGKKPFSNQNEFKKIGKNTIIILKLLALADIMILIGLVMQYLNFK